MTVQEKQMLKELLVKMSSESEPASPDEPQGRPPGFIPEVCLKEFYKATRTPFVELIIFRRRNGEFEYLYQDRKDQWWDGFCAFGGMVRSNHPESPVDVAQKLLDREFRGLNIKVATLQVVSFLNWQVHPWCNPFAVVCLITVDGEIPEGGDRHWLRQSNLPDRMVSNHGEYLGQCEHFLKTGSPLMFTPSNPLGIPEVPELV